MPFPDVTIKGETKNFEQVLNGFIHYVKPLLMGAVERMPYMGWEVTDYLSAAETMVAQSSDRLWAAAIDASGNSKADLLDTRLSALELQLSRIAEQISSLQGKA